MKKKKSKKTLFYFGLIVLIPLFCFIVGEGIIRLHIILSGKKGFIWADDEYLGRVHISGSRFVDHEDFSGEFRALRKTNSLGLIGREISLKKPVNTFRIVVLGDSFTEALQVPEGKNFCERLQIFLNQQFSLGGRSFEVVNAGMSGYSPVSEYLYLKRELLKLKPDIIVLQLFANDVFEDHKITAMSVLDADSLPVKIRTCFTKETINGPIIVDEEDVAASLSYKVTRFLMKRSRFFKYMDALVGKRKRRSDVHEQMILPPLYNDANQFFIIQTEHEFFQDTNFREQAWMRTKGYILAMKSLVEAHNARLFVLLIPPEAQVDFENQSVSTKIYFTQEPNLYFNQTLEKFCQQESVFYLDLLPYFKKQKASVIYSNRDGHLTRTGHELAAQVLMNKLMEYGLADEKKISP